MLLARFSTSACIALSSCNLTEGRPSYSSTSLANICFKCMGPCLPNPVQSPVAKILESNLAAADARPVVVHGTESGVTRGQLHDAYGVPYLQQQNIPVASLLFQANAVHGNTVSSVDNPIVNRRYDRDLQDEMGTNAESATCAADCEVCPGQKLRIDAASMVSGHCSGWAL